MTMDALCTVATCGSLKTALYGLGYRGGLGEGEDAKEVGTLVVLAETGGQCNQAGLCGI